MWDWIGFGAYKVPLSRSAPPEERIERSKAMLARVLDLGTAVAFVGSGLSQPLGYPSWTNLASGVVELTLNTLGEQPKALESFEIERLSRFRELLKAPNNLGSDRLMSFITICQRALFKVGEREVYYEYIRKTFDPNSKTPSADNPYTALMELPIYRFATTNYDCELERALIQNRKIQPERFGIEAFGGHGQSIPTKDLLSFTPQKPFCNQMAIFPIAWTNANANMVFHCHGRYDQPESVIAGELEYQELYFSNERGQGPVYRQSIDLLLGSNPLLFIGYGLGDEDLLRPLRLLHALDREGKRDRPLFALMSQRQLADIDQQELLYDRYGLNVIPFDAPVSNDPANWGQRYCEALRGLKEHWQVLRRRWIEKPVFRRATVPVRAPKPYRYPKILDTSLLALDPKAHFDEVQQRIQGLIRKDIRVLVLLGATGSGKTLHAVKMFEHLACEDEFAGYFFWDVNFSDDALTGREHLLRYLDPDHELQGTYIERIRERLRAKRYLLVIEGAERLLRQGKHPEEGNAFSQAFAEALRVFADPRSESTVVLVSTLWPLELDSSGGEGAPVQKLKLSQIHAADLDSLSAFDGLDHSQISALCGILDGHAYGLLLAMKFLSRGSCPIYIKRLDHLLLHLGKKIPEERVDAMVALIIEELDEEGSMLAKPFLERLAVFISPFGPDTVEICYDQTVSALGISKIDLISVLEMRDRLVASCLLLEMDVGRASGTTFYALHPIVRSYLHKIRDRPYKRLLPGFDLNGLVADKIGPQLESREAFEIVWALFEELARRANEALDADDKKSARDVVRRLFSLTRARLSTFSIIPWAGYDCYAALLYRMLALVKRASPRSWTHCSSEDLRTVEDPDGVLYPGDQAWLYNELGLVLEVGGLAADAEAIWGQGCDINRLIEGTGDTDGQREYVQQSFLNLGDLFVDLGQLSRAEEYLRQGEYLGPAVADAGIAGCIRGFQAIVEWLRNDVQKSDELYTEAREKLKASGNNRGLTYFTTQHALLRYRQGRFEEMPNLIQASRSLALREGYHDLVPYIDIAVAQEFENRGDLFEARRHYEKILRNTRELGDSKVECIVLSDLSRVARRQGDTEGARRLAMDGLSVANTIGLRSRQLRLLKGLGDATKASGEQNLAIAYLELVKVLAEEAGNLLTLYEAEERLREVGEPATDGRSLF